MASSSTNSSIRKKKKSYKYDVFLSFRGKDTRNNFVGHQYHALQQKGIETYKDDEKIKKGKTVNDELAKIMKCQKGQTGRFSIFYDMEPTDIRKDSGAFNYAFANMKRNRLLGLRKEKRVLWQGYPFWSLLKTFQANNLVRLDMYSSDIVHLWEDGEGKVLYKLGFLKLNSLKLKTLDIRLAPNIEKLSIFACYDLLEVQMPAESLKLISLNVCYSKLKTLHLGITPNLEELSLEGCNDLVELYMPTECPKLISLHLIGSKLSILHLAITLNLKTLNLEDCKDLVELYISDSLKLKSLNLVSHSKLRILHLGITPNLEMLSLEKCCNLVELHMPFGCPNLRSMDLCQTMLRTLDIGLTPNLERLYLTDCSYLVETFPEEIGRLECLKELDITCTYISHLPQSIFQLKGLRIVGDRWLLDSFGLTPKTHRTTDGNGETFCYI
ncbi:Toll/interleukin-1 receptor domain-containing protein [Tanacetum coccineum]|uniref:Toll/interleukin-1 receptor domain-containing protein n=1 Tax=Tanacetum coccineum TaxID=301880 RepID=A0ABQ5CG57_9ASTR